MSSIKALYGLFKNFRKEQTVVCGLIIADILLTAWIPFLLKDLINYITQGEGGREFVRTGVLILGLTLLNIVFQIAQNYRWHSLRLKSVNFLRAKAFETALRKSLSFFKASSVGEILAKIIDDVVIVAQHASVGLPMLFANVFQLVVVVTFLFILEVKLAILVLLVIPFYYLGFNYLNRRMREASALEREEFGKVMKDAQEKILGIRTIKIFRKESYIAGKFKKVLDSYFHYEKRELFLQACGSGLTVLIMTFLPVIILLYGGSLAINKEITVGSLIAFYTYLSYLYEPVRNLSDFNMGFQTTLGMAERVMGFLTDVEDNVHETVAPMDSFKMIEFKDVSFYYDQDKSVLKRLNFTIEKGDRVAIIGESGSGKSTILNLIMKLYTPIEGQILINGMDLMDVKKDSLYSKITLLDQDNFLFNGTIFENITFGEAYHLSSVKRAAKLASILPLINALKEGFEHNISESGLNFSGGERQRLSLARALIKEADLILLDEATSSVDYGIENEIVSHLDTYLSSEKTLIAVSHRPKILEICNKVIHLEKGDLVRVYNIGEPAAKEQAMSLISKVVC